MIVAEVRKLLAGWALGLAFKLWPKGGDDATVAVLSGIAATANAMEDDAAAAVARRQSS